MIEMPVSELAIKQFQRMLEAAANGGKLHCIEEKSGSKIFYIRQALRPDEDFLNRVLFGKPGPGQPAPVLRLVVDNSIHAKARTHVDSSLPELLSSPSTQALKHRSPA